MFMDSAWNNLVLNFSVFLKRKFIFQDIFSKIIEIFLLLLDLLILLLIVIQIFIQRNAFIFVFLFGGFNQVIFSLQLQL